LLDDNDLGDAAANDIFKGHLDPFADKTEYEITGEEYGDTLATYNNVEYATFFDLLEDNMIDIILVIDNGGGK